MKILIVGASLLLSMACSAQPITRPKVPESVMVSNAGGPVSLVSVLDGKRTMVLAVEAGSSKASTWTEQLKSSQAASARGHTVVMLVYAPQQKSKADQLIQSSPGIRFVEDPGLAAMQALKLPGLPAMLGIAADGTIAWQQMGDLPGARSVVDVIDSWMKLPVRKP